MQFSQPIFDIICERIAEGESLRGICKDEGMPTASNVCRWIDDDEGGTRLKQYARAREAQADKIFDECLAIADSQENDVSVVDGVEQTNHDVIARAKLRIDTRKWMAGKLRPKVYGDKLAIGGAEGLPPIETRDNTAVDLLKARLDAIARRTSGPAAEG